ncbi:MAG: hypothetical protein ACE1ZQ_03175 [Ignavibacteriaceae bacterium]
MKYLIPLALLATLLLFACGDKSISPIEPDNHSDQLIKLQPKAGFSVGKTFSISKKINGDKGGTIKLKKSYFAEDGHKVKIDVKFKVKKHSFEGKVDIRMTVNVNNASVMFTPHMIFNKRASLEVKFEGIDLEKLDRMDHEKSERGPTGEYDFVFIDHDGNIETIDHDRIKVDERKGKIQVKKAKLDHFSRYAFIR